MLNVSKKLSPNFNERHNGASPSYLIIHATNTETASDAEQYYLGMTHDAAGRISPHYMIDFDGSITQYVEEQSRAWHAGVSYWKGNTDLNSLSIGIELVNNSKKPFTDNQFISLVDLSREIVLRNSILPENILGHSDIAPLRRADPGWHFPWHKFAEEGIGLFPSEYDAASGATEETLRKSLVELGYDPSCPLDKLCEVFAMHYATELKESYRENAALEILQGKAQALLLKSKSSIT